MRILLWLATGFVAVVAGAVGAIYVVLQTTDLAAYQGLVASKVEEVTGRTLRIGGPVRVALSLHPTVIAEDVQFANAPGGAEPNMVTVARIEVQLALIPLLRRELRLDSVTLVKPRIVLQADIKGRPNWQFAGSPAPGAAAATGGDLSPNFHPGISRVRSSFEPVWLGGATGRGAEPHSERSAPSRCTSEALSLA